MLTHIKTDTDGSDAPGFHSLSQQHVATVAKTHKSLKIAPYAPMHAKGFDHHSATSKKCTGLHRGITADPHAELTAPKNRPAASAPKQITCWDLAYCH
jgi:hypothetical protein